MPQTIIYCSKRVKSLWPSPLAQRWKAEYPQLFDRDDVRLARNQPTNHFVEWFAAIHLFQRDGVLSLVEKYVFRTHPKKQQLLSDLLRPEDIDALRDISRSTGAQLPDLMLHEAGRLVGFAEVKGPRDRLSTKQKQTHQALKRHFGVATEILNVKLR